MNFLSYKNFGIISNALGEFLEQIIQLMEKPSHRKARCDYERFISLDYNINHKLHFLKDRYC